MHKYLGCNHFSIPTANSMNSEGHGISLLLSRCLGQYYRKEKVRVDCKNNQVYGSKSKLQLLYRMKGKGGNKISPKVKTVIREQLLGRRR